jgi:glycosyltransferase involved in cell wall biosynthesis
MKGDTRHHVLFLIDAFNRTAGGAEGTLIKLCRSLPPERYRCSVVTFKKGTGVDVNEHFSCPFHIFKFGTTLGWSAFKAAMRLNQLIRSERVTIAHSFFPTSDLWGGVVAKLAGCPILVSSRRDMGFLRQRKHRFAYRLCNRMFDQVQAVSDKVREFSIREDHLDPSRVVTLHNGVDLDEVQSVKPLATPEMALSIPASSNVVVTVGNLRPVKGIDVLLRAAAIVRKTFPETVFLVVGEPHGQIYFDELKNLAGTLGVEKNIRFLGLRKDPLAILKISDVFCLPSRTEGLSNALLEAMACSLPCVATNVGGNPELVKDGKNGFLVPSEEPEAMASRITDLLQDRELARRMGACGRRSVEDNFTVGHMVGRLVELYDALLEQYGLQYEPGA